MSDEQICGLVLLWFLAAWLGKTGRSFLRTAILFWVFVAVLTGCTRGGYCYHQAHRTARNYAHAVAGNQRRRRHQSRVVGRRLVREAAADRRLREHSQLRPVPTFR
jgi:uncharacterized protein (DUF2126 family)